MQLYITLHAQYYDGLGIELVYVVVGLQTASGWSSQRVGREDACNIDSPGIFWLNHMQLIQFILCPRSLQWVAAGGERR